MYATAPATADQIAEFVAAIKAMKDAHTAKNFDRLVADCVVTAERGPKYTRIVMADPHRSAFCFVENATGLILKCDGWKRPAKHARGTIHTETKGVEYLGPYGPGYLR